jgi:hypothetical protein
MFLHAKVQDSRKVVRQANNKKWGRQLNLSEKAPEGPFTAATSASATSQLTGFAMHLRMGRARRTLFPADGMEIANECSN